MLNACVACTIHKGNFIQLVFLLTIICICMYTSSWYSVYWFQLETQIIERFSLSLSLPLTLKFFPLCASRGFFLHLLVDVIGYANIVLMSAKVPSFCVCMIECVHCSKYSIFVVEYCWCCCPFFFLFLPLLLLFLTNYQSFC